MILWIEINDLLKFIDDPVVEKEFKIVQNKMNKVSKEYDKAYHFLGDVSEAIEEYMEMNYFD